MRKKSIYICGFLLICLAVSFLVGCSGNSDSSSSVSASSSSSSSSKNHKKSEKRTTISEYLLPTAPGTVVYGNEILSIDASNISEGYFMIQYQGAADKVKLQVTIPDGTIYTYTLAIGSYEAFPLSGGDGSYHLDVLEHAYDDMYALSFSQDISVTLNDEFKPFLYPNQYVWFTQDYEAVKYASKLSDSSSNDLDYVEQVYNYVIGSIKYDEELAENVESGYLPNIDNTMKTKKNTRTHQNPCKVRKHRFYILSIGFVIIGLISKKS